MAVWQIRSFVARRHCDKLNGVFSFAMKALPFSLLLLWSACCTPGTTRADETVQVGTYGELVDAITLANSYSGGGLFTISFTATIDAALAVNASQFFINLDSATNLVVDGGGHSLDMRYSDRAFYVAQGNVLFSNLTIDRGYGLGGNGGSGAGGGMGAGGAIYVANRGTGTEVTLANVNLRNNVAKGGNGGERIINEDADDQPAIGGGGGMGGNGGQGNIAHVGAAKETYGGGGGFGKDAHGGTGTGTNTDEEKATSGGSGAYVGGNSGGAGASNYTHGEGGEKGGGGGASYNEESGLWARGAAGAGGVDGGVGLMISNSGYGGVGGYGGGGGGASHYGGDGGFGGGGGSSYHSSDSGTGGFGGGGAFTGTASGHNGGFGGGGGTSTNEFHPRSYGGGGMGAGGAVFVEKGAALIINDTLSGSSGFFANTAEGGIGNHLGGGAGAALGANFFLGGDLTYEVATQATLTGVGGGGDTSDSRVAGKDTNNNAKGGLIKTGTGTLSLTGNNNYAGATQIRAGKLVLETAALFSSGYQIASGATLEIGVDDFRPGAITLTAGGHLIITGNRTDLSDSTFEAGTLTLDGSANDLNSTSNDLRVAGNGTLEGFASLATFGPSNLTFNNATWSDDVIFEFILGETAFTSTDSSRFTNVTAGGLSLSILNLASDVRVGDRVELFSFADASTFDLAKFSLTSGLGGFAGELYQEELGGGGVTLGVRVDAVPEPGTLGLLALASLGLWAAHRKTKGVAS